MVCAGPGLDNPCTQPHRNRSLIRCLNACCAQRAPRSDGRHSKKPKFEVGVGIACSRTPRLALLLTATLSLTLLQWDELPSEGDGVVSDSEVEEEEVLPTVEVAERVAMALPGLPLVLSGLHPKYSGVHHQHRNPL